MNLLTEKSLGPPGGWKYTQPESKHVFTGISWNQLFEKVRKHRAGNGYDLGEGWEQRFEEEFCRQNQLLGTRWCPQEDHQDKLPGCGGYESVRRFLNSAWNVVKAKGDVFVEKEEAERRAAICASCLMNATVPACYGCNGFREMIAKIRGSRSTVQDQHLRQCAVCCCENSVKVWIKEEVVDNTGLEYPDHCWAKKTGTESKPTK